MESGTAGSSMGVRWTTRGSSVQVEYTLVCSGSDKWLCSKSGQEWRISGFSVEVDWKTSWCSVEWNGAEDKWIYSEMGRQLT